MNRYIVSTLIGLLFTISASAQKRVQTLIQKGHGESVKAIAISNDGQYLFSASRDQTVRLWNAENGHEIRVFKGHTHTVNSLDISHNTEFLASGSADGTAKIWAVKTGETLWTSPKSDLYKTAVSLHPFRKYIAVGGYDKKVSIWDWDNNILIAEFEVKPDRSTGYGVDLKFSPDGKFLAIGQDNRQIQVVETEKWTEKWNYQAKEGWCGGCGTLVAFSPDNQTVLSANHYGGLTGFEVATGKINHHYKEKVRDLMDLAYAPDGQSIVMTTEDSIFLYQHGGALIKSFKPSDTQTNAAIFTLDSNLVIAEDQGLVYSYDVNKGQLIQPFAGTLYERDFGGLKHDLSNYWERAIAQHIKYKNNQLLIANQWLLKGKMGTKGVLWNIEAGKPTHELTGHKKGVVAFDYSAPDDFIITGDGAGEIIRWQAKTGKELMRYKGHRSTVFDLVFSHDKSKFASCGWDGNIIVWDTQTGEQIQRIYFSNVAGYELEFSHNDEYLIIGFLDKKLQLWDIDTKSMVKEFIGHTDIVTSIHVIDEQTFTSTAKDGKMIKWHIGYGTKVQKYQVSDYPIFTHLHLPEKEAFLTAGQEGIIQMWDKKSRRVLKTFTGHQVAVTALNVNATKTVLFSLDLDGVTKAWDLNTGNELYEFIQLDKSEWVIKSPEGFFMGTSEALKKVHFVKDMESFSLDQFFEVFYQPKVITDLLELGAVNRKESIHQMMDKLSAPKVKIAALKDEDGHHAEVYIKVDGKSIKGIQLLHNGKALAIKEKDLEVYQKSKNSISYRVLQPLISGHNEFSCKAIGTNGVESALASVDIISNRNSPGADCYLFTIGIDAYKNKKLNLNYATADARSFADSIVKFSDGMYRNIYVNQLFDDQATKQNINHLMDSLSKKMTLNDVFIFYFAGHGSITDGHFYFITHETTRLYSDAKQMSKSAISEEEMMEAFQQVKALKQIIVMDACQSGGAVEKLAQRGALEEKAIAQLSRSAGVHVLASAGSEQFATEYESLGHGIFTYCLLQALSGKADGSPADNKVTLFELKSYLHDQVPGKSMELKGTAQYPFTFSRGHDFPIVIKE